MVSCNGQSFRENILFTHRGISGPAMLQISSFWQLGDAVEINLLPDHDALEWLQTHQVARPDSELKTLLAEVFTRKMAALLTDDWFASKPMKQYTPAELRDVADKLGAWQVVPAGTEGYRTAEVTVGGVDTREVSSKTMNRSGALACTSSARCSTSPATWAVSTPVGLGVGLRRGAVRLRTVTRSSLPAGNTVPAAGCCATILPALRRCRLVRALRRRG